jgi:hypothetical protein
MADKPIPSDTRISGPKAGGHTAQSPLLPGFGTKKNDDGENTSSMKLLVVLGMHRSGTSAITRGLQALGVCLGENLMAPQTDFNDKGFFEDNEIVQLNEEMLSALGSCWDALPPICPSKFKNLEKFQSRALSLLHSKLQLCGGIFAFKDPRTPQLMPFWKDVFAQIDADVRYLLPIRHPMSVAESLKKMGFSQEKSFYLWLNRVTASLLHTEGKNRLLVDYDLLMENPAPQLKRIAESFSLPFDPDSPHVQEYTGKFLEKRLRHTCYKQETLRADPAANNDVLSVYNLLTQMAAGRQTVDLDQLQKTARDTQERLLGMAPVFHYLRQLEERELQMHEQLVQQDARFDEVVQQVESFQRWQDSWFRRAFHRWHPPGCETTRGFLRRLQRSVAKRLKTTSTPPLSGESRPGDNALKNMDSSISFSGIRSR